MSIVINNISTRYSRTAMQKYEVCLNRIPLTQFEHLGSDGMAVCLAKAAKALEEIDIDQKIEDYRNEQIALHLFHSTKIHNP